MCWITIKIYQIKSTWFLPFLNLALVFRCLRIIGNQNSIKLVLKQSHPKEPNWKARFDKSKEDSICYNNKKSYFPKISKGSIFSNQMCFSGNSKNENKDSIQIFFTEKADHSSFMNQMPVLLYLCLFLNSVPQWQT